MRLFKSIFSFLIKLSGWQQLIISTGLISLLIWTTWGTSFALRLRSACGDLSAEYQLAIALDPKYLPLNKRIICSGAPIGQEICPHSECKTVMAAIQLVASKGYPDAMYETGLFCRNGRGTPKNLVYANEWFEKAAQCRLPQAEEIMANIHLEAGHREQAIVYYQRAIDDYTNFNKATSDNWIYFSKQQSSRLSKHLHYIINYPTNKNSNISSNPN